MDSQELIKTKLEPEVAQMATGGIEQSAAISIAISLKRIADAWGKSPEQIEAIRQLSRME